MKRSSREKCRPELDSDNYERLAPLATDLNVSISFLVNTLLRNIKVLSIRTDAELKASQVKTPGRIITVQPSSKTYQI
jgi:hypothetical protein